MKKIAYYLIGLILLLVISNSSYLRAFWLNFKSVESVKNNDFNSALVALEKANQIFDDQTLKYNLAGVYYKLKSFEKSYGIYSVLLNNCDGLQMCFRINHNLGNNMYRIGESQTGDNRISNWKQSLVYYDKALQLRFDQQTFDNKEFVKKKLEEYENNQKPQNTNQNNNQNNNQQQKSNESKENQNSSQGNSSSSSTKGSEDKNNSSGESSSSSSQIGQQGGSSSLGNSTQKLNNEQKQQLENYMNYLQQQQKENQDSFNKKQSKNNLNDTDSIINGLFGNPFEEEVFSDLNTDSDKKDW